MRHALTLLTLITVVLTTAIGGAVVVPGGGSKTSDCMSVFDAPSANSPARYSAAQKKLESAGLIVYSAEIHARIPEPSTGSEE